MTSRQQRRAAERVARKHARDSDTVEAGSVPASNSEQRLAANRANAQLSTGPRTAQGKTASSKNAITTALTGRTVLLPSDDADRYQRHLTAYAKSFAPVGERELELVQALADAAWRLDRIPGLEEAIYCKGASEFAAEVTETDPHARLTMLRMHTLLAYERPLRNLHTQEARLHRLREKLQLELQQLQSQRQTAERETIHNAAMQYHAAKLHGTSFVPAAHGFEFSIAEIEAYLRRVKQQSESQTGLPPSFYRSKERTEAA